MPAAEQGHVKRTLSYNGYPTDSVDSRTTCTLCRFSGDSGTQHPTRDIRILMPYYQGVNEKIQTIS
ncbi:hypothetical protein M514_07302 [Trichuris suis]|uniref:Uncharacterized protein n=1 Tax=Trichuris suis TaxID=68888 RepID=A0A085M3H9_9BILA|nr:hypothetical protein M513_07302 [Trichuris suis]KFD64195.1 hypothetical protein M514_07302 [Trichuris suis]